MGMVRPEVRLAYRRGSTDLGRGLGVVSKHAGDGDHICSEGDQSDCTSRPANLTPHQEKDDIANPADRTS